ncbi:MAG: O-antigen polymerase [Bacteroidota bacterium]
MGLILTIVVILCFEVIAFGIFRKLYFISILNVLLVFSYLFLPYIIYYTGYNKFELVSYRGIKEPPQLEYYIAIVAVYLFLNTSFYVAFFWKKIQIFDNRKKLVFSTNMYVIVLILSLVLYGFYISSVGFIGSLSSGFEIRSGDLDLGAQGVAIRMLPITTTIMIFLVYDKVVLHTRSHTVLLVIYVLLFLFWTLSTAGRSAIVTPVITVVIAYFLYAKTHRIRFNLKKIGIAGITFGFLVLFALYGKSFFTVLPFIIKMDFAEIINNYETYRELNNLSDYNILSNLVKEYGQGYYTLDSLFKNGDFDFLYFRDVWDAIRDYVPERVFNVNIDLYPSVSRINTARLFDGYDAASYPPGYLGFLYYSLGISGIILGSLAMGFITARLNVFYMRYRHNNPFAILWTSILLLTIASYFINGDVRVFSRDAFLSIIIVLVLWKIDKIKFR